MYTPPIKRSECIFDKNDVGLALKLTMRNNSVAEVCRPTSFDLGLVGRGNLFRDCVEPFLNSSFGKGSGRNQYLLSWFPDLELPKKLFVNNKGEAGIRENDIGKVDDFGWLEPVEFNCKVGAHLSGTYVPPFWSC
jgi:hypothetical protein